MISTPHPWWPTVALAVILFSDALMSLRPPGFIRQCLEGVRFPREWWWSLIGIKLLATAGLLLGLRWTGVGITVNAGVIAYFLFASAAHVKARFVKQEFWVNCLGMLGISTLVLVFSYVVNA